MAVNEQALRHIDAWLDAGLYLRVHALLEELRADESVDAGLRRVRALRYLGAEREGDALALRLGRGAPQRAEAVIGLLRTTLYNRGAFAYWRASQRWTLPAAADEQAQAQYLSLRGLWLAELRDFGEAQQHHARALSLTPDDPWLWVEQSYSLMRQDRYDEALEAARHALSLRPDYRAAIQQVAHLLVLQQSRGEAMELLTQALRGSECAALALQLHDLLFDAEHFNAALEHLDLAERWMPCADRRTRARLAARRTDALMALGRLDEARAQATLVPGPGFYTGLVERLATPPAGTRRVLLQLEFVRQHWATCAPATLASLTRFWGLAAEHLEIAQAICYDGTAEVSERLWAKQQGLLTHEFRLDWTSACALLDAGVPFALVTQHAGGGHLQAVVGYDRLRGTLLIRDPYQHVHAEFEASGLFDAQELNGPRALLLVPQDQAWRLEGIDLPEVHAWDRLHTMQAALQVHDRAAALAQLECMRALDAGTRLLWRAERHLAVYDGNEPAILAATEALLAMFPRDANLQLSKVASLGAIGGQQACLAYLETLAEQPLPEPLLLSRLAGQLAEDGRRLPRAFQVLRRALRRAPTQARLWGQWATLLWQDERRAEALPVYRWAACLQPTDEDAACAYARACRFLGQSELGLTFLQERVQQWGDRSALPAMSLFEQLNQLERRSEAHAVLAEAMRRRPDDAELKLYAAEAQLREQQLATAQALLDAATQPLRQASRLRVGGLLAEAKGAFDDALVSAREAAELEPFNLAHHRLVMRLLARREGRGVALAWLQTVASHHPGHYGLHRLLYDWVPDEAGAINAQLEQMMRMHPADPWLRRELAAQASRQGRHDDAVQLAELACALAPQRSDSHGTLAFARLRRDGYAAALPDLQQAVRLDVDYDYALRTLISAAPDPQQAQAAADFAAAELLRQVTVGEALLTFQAVAGRAMPVDALEALLRQAQAERPDLWQSWVALGRMLLETGRAEPAQVLLQRAIEHFPGLPRLYVEHAETLRLLGRREAAIEAVACALGLSPGWNRAVRLQLDLLQEQGGGWPAAELVVRRALLSEAQDDDLIGLLAWLLERQQRGPEALAEARRSLMLNPRPDWIWRIARRICEVAEDLPAFDALLEEVRASRPGDAWAWTMLAQQLRDDAAALQAAEQALRLEPRLETAWAARFQRLARLGRHAEIEALLPALPWPEQAPMGLRAWGPRCAWECGRPDQALARQRTLIAEAPHDEDLWRDLADWLDSHEDHAGYLQAAQEMLRLAPHQAKPHAYVGHALVKLRRHGDAVEPLRQALEIDPSYAFAARWLAEAARGAASHELAEQALQTWWVHGASARVAGLGVQAACAAASRERALQWLDRLFACSEYDLEHSRQAIDALRAAGWGVALEPRQLAQLEAGEGPPGVGLDWLMEGQSRRGMLLTLFRAHRLMRRVRGPSLQRAVLRWLGSGEHGLALLAFAAAHDKALRADELAWGEVGYALLRMDRNRALLRWMHDWRERPRAPIWALANLCSALCMLGRWQVIEEVLARALPRAPYQEDLRLWQLTLHALRGRLTELERELALTHEWTPDDWMKPPLEALRHFADLARRRAEGDTVSQFRDLAPRMGNVTAQRLFTALRRGLVLRHTPWTRLWRWVI
ncbi:MAG: C39 family peptidase [Burkholderiaceae bacterium]|nr:C39 family peptidase [Burkholderiaceae bacterium]